MIALSPFGLTLAFGLALGTLFAQVEFADGALFDFDVPRPDRHGMPLLQSEDRLFIRNFFHY